MEYVRGFDQAIAERHHLGLRYPPRLLVNAIALALRGLSGQKPYGALGMTDRNLGY
ncbi:hypothetical protein HED50_22875 [Ochrobactrum oryzae]|nr:hypothetical protein [Brucella oryzae]